MAKLDRAFVWPPRLAVRVILDTFERSFEAWLLSGNPEAGFPSSLYVRRTLPTILEELTRPATATSRSPQSRARGTPPRGTTSPVLRPGFVGGSR